MLILLSERFHKSVDWILRGEGISRTHRIRSRFWPGTSSGLPIIRPKPVRTTPPNGRKSQVRISGQ